MRLFDFGMQFRGSKKGVRMIILILELISKPLVLKLHMKLEN
jgi:hypothetical protein